MKLGFRRALLGGLALMGLVGMQAAPAGATLPNVAVVALTGSGNVTPGVHPLPTGQQLFVFTAATIAPLGVVHKQVVTPLQDSSCGAFGKDGLITPTDVDKTKNGWPGDTLAFGTGLGTWFCTDGPFGGKGGLLYYTRVGPVVTVTLTEGSKPTETVVGVLACVFVPVETPVVQLVQNFDLACVGLYVDSTLP